jgi:photosystem II stability/assembly factor-like uncharacterized protein
MFRRNVLRGAAGLGLAAVVPLRHAQAQAGVPSSEAYRWTNLPFGGGGFIGGISFHPRERGLLYARSDIGGIYRHDPAADRWVPLLDGLSFPDAELMSVLSLALDPADPDRVYAACGLSTGEWARKGALLVSTDRGRNWSIHNLDIKLGGLENGRGTGECLQVDPHLPNVLILGTTRDGLLRSADRGQSFKPLPFKPRQVSLVMFDPSSAAPDSGCRRLWVGSQDQPGLYVSEDGGQSFAKVPGLPDQIPQRATMARDRTLYVTFALGKPGEPVNPGNALNGSVWRRDRNGQWSDITPVKPGAPNVPFGYSAIDVDPRLPGRVVVSTIERWWAGEGKVGEEMYLSLDSGQSWQPLADRSRHNDAPYPWLVHQRKLSGRMGFWIADLKIDPFDSSRLLYGTAYGLWETRNLAAAQKDEHVLWEFSAKGMELTSPGEIRSPSGGVALLAALGGLAGGAAWEQVDAAPNAGLFMPRNEGTSSVDYAEGAPAIIARTCESDAGGRVSTDGGVQWRAFGGLPRTAGLPSPRGGRIAVSAGGGFMVWAPTGSAALRSQDRGKTWQPCAGWPDPKDGDLVPVADRTTEGVFYVHDVTRGRILQSVDGGRQFAPAILRLPVLNRWQTTQLVCAPGTLRDLWLILPDGLVHLPGVDQPARGIKNVIEPRRVALGKAAPGATYHTLYLWGVVKLGGAEVSGLFRSTDRGASFTRIDDDAHRFGNLLSISADPLEYGVIYLASRGRGIVVGRPAAGT